MPRLSPFVSSGVDPFSLASLKSRCTETGSNCLCHGRHPRRIFVNSMSDLFHDEVPLDFIAEVFSVMERADRHVFQVLTKRHERLLEVYEGLPWPPNVWMGVSVENQYWAERRIPNLIQVPASVRFLSAEPLLKPLTLGPFLKDIDWVIVGGESGPKARPMEEDWVIDIRDDCVAHDVPFFFKQWGGKTSKAGGRSLEGSTWSEMPLPNSARKSLDSRILSMLPTHNLKSAMQQAS